MATKKPQKEKKALKEAKQTKKLTAEEKLAKKNNKRKEKHSLFYHFKYSNSLLRKLVVSSGSIIIFALIISAVVTFLITKQTVTEDFQHSAIQLLNQSKTYIELIHNNIENSSNLLIKDKEFISLYSKKIQDERKREIIRTKIRSELSRVADNTLSGIINNIYLFNDEGLTTANVGVYFPDNKINKVKKTNWYQEAIKKDGESFWTDPYKDIFVYSGTSVISHVRLVKDYITKKLIGVLSINIFPQMITAALTEAKIGKDGFIITINQNGYIVAHRNNEMVEQKLGDNYLKHLKGRKGDFVFKENGRDMYAVYTTSDVVDWKFIAVVPQEELYSSATAIGFWSILIIIGCIFVSIGVSFVNTIQVTQPIREIIRLTKEISKGNYDVQANQYKVYELNQLSADFNTMGGIVKEVMRKLDNQIELVNADLRMAHDDLKGKHELLEEKQALIERELNFAKNVQQRLLPAKRNDLPVDLAQQMHVATAVGGDFYCLKYYNMRMSLAIGDVSGHGVPSALVMVLMRDAFINFSDHKKDPAEVLKLMNEKAINEIEPGMFTTFFYAELHCLTNEMTYCNGGHNNPLLFHKDKIFQLDSPGLILGVDSSAHYESKKIKVLEGDILFLYTDGISEMRSNGDPGGEMLGINPILKIIKENRSKSADEITELINDLIIDFGGEPPYEDDVTFVVLKI